MGGGASERGRGASEECGGSFLHATSSQTHTTRGAYWTTTPGTGLLPCARTPGAGSLPCRHTPEAGSLSESLQHPPPCSSSQTRCFHTLRSPPVSFTPYIAHLSRSHLA
eukprot:357547-Chlamydomonas_euryale.AAC.2